MILKVTTVGRLIKTPSHSTQLSIPSSQKLESLIRRTTDRNGRRSQSTGKWQRQQSLNFDPFSTTSEPDSLTIKEAQQVVDHWIKDVGVRYFSELTNLAQLVEEVGELARIISRKFGEQSFKESDKHGSLSDEMADVLFVLICLANQTGVDLNSAFNQNLAKKTKRDADRHRNNPKLNDETEPSGGT